MTTTMTTTSTPSWKMHKCLVQRWKACSVTEQAQLRKELWGEIVRLEAQLIEAQLRDRRFPRKIGAS